MTEYRTLLSKQIIRSNSLRIIKAIPLIETLTQIFSLEQDEELLHCFPNYDPAERDLEPHLRVHCVQRLYRYFQPLDVHIDIEQRISRIIRQGYISRNPVSMGYGTVPTMLYHAIRERDSDFTKLKEFPERNPFPASATGLTMIGVSGIGKTTAVQKVLSTYPQLIEHSKYKGIDFNHLQIVWLKLDCPHDGSVKGLCTNLFSEFDRLAGENTYEKFASSRNNTVNLMIPRMAMIARRHSLGVLVVDEIQHLSAAKSGGSAEMLNFFVTLVNTIGIPVILIGQIKRCQASSGISGRHAEAADSRAISYGRT